MPRLSVVPEVPPPPEAEARDGVLRQITHDLRALLVTGGGDAYALRASLPAGSARRDAADIESAGQCAGVLVEQLAALLAVTPADAREGWETD